jgi:hypothetical protein
MIHYTKAVRFGFKPLTFFLAITNPRRSVRTDKIDDIKQKKEVRTLSFIPLMPVK